MRWKVMTFNLRVNVESDGDNAWPRRYEAVARTILRHKADLVCIQEGLYSMLRDLEPLLGEEYDWIGEGRRGGREDEYCAIFYRKHKWRLREHGSFGLSDTPDRLGTLAWNAGCPRMCTWARLREASGDFEFAVFNTHLDHVSEEAQIKGMELIRRTMTRKGEEAGLPTVLTGDFNVGPEHEVVRGLERSGLRNAYVAAANGAGSVGRTFHGFVGGSKGEPIDYIFCSPDVSVERVKIDRSEEAGRYPSDHYPVISELYN